ncbi:hypothetical protein IMY97_22350 [Pectobacterium versatile]|uniref:hypothetical protein n=1 Tax=Pectobacterium versatile TaxID=2488639 RepID=UPI001FA7E549|nr:hypothetical protein [Pectobacterium versatile]UNE79050.1 hypothetical protein IMY97_22350 [Pectobacterium versatile]
MKFKADEIWAGILVEFPGKNRCALLKTQGFKFFKRENPAPDKLIKAGKILKEAGFRVLT